MPTAIVSLGSNLGDRAATLDGAIAALDAAAGVRVVRRSTWYETSPIGGPAMQDPFLNGAAILETTLDPDALLTELQRIENEHGREREQHWGPRTLDLDLLTYDDVVCHTPRLTLPHPRLSYRKFVLKGVVEVAGDFRHPLLNRTYRDLKRHLDEAPHYVAFVGPRSSGGADFRTQFAAEAADCGAATLVEATPRDVPAFAEFAAASGLDSGMAIKFMKARLAAIHDSLASAGEKWIVDDGWLPAELGEALRRFSLDEVQSFAITATTELHGTDEIVPKLLVVLRSKDEMPAAAVHAFKRLLPFIELPPIVDLDISDRERALTEFAAALDAAR